MTLQDAQDILSISLVVNVVLMIRILLDAWTFRKPHVLYEEDHD